PAPRAGGGAPDPAPRARAIRCVGAGGERGLRPRLTRSACSLRRALRRRRLPRLSILACRLADAYGTALRRPACAAGRRLCPRLLIRRKQMDKLVRTKLKQTLGALAASMLLVAPGIAAQTGSIA